MGRKEEAMAKLCSPPPTLSVSGGKKGDQILRGEGRLFGRAKQVVRLKRGSFRPAEVEDRMGLL